MSTRTRPDRHPRAEPPAASTPAPSRTSEPQPDQAAERLAYSVDEAARLTGLSRDLLYNQMRQGNLAYIKVGRRRLITRRHLEEFLYIGPEPVTYPAGARGVEFQCGHHSRPAQRSTSGRLGRGRPHRSRNEGRSANRRNLLPTTTMGSHPG